MRSISIGSNSGKLKMTLFEGTEDSVNCIIKSINKKPYVLYCGTKYYLTNEEIEAVKILMQLF